MLDIDFTLLDNAKEDFVREMIIAPLLQKLGFVPKSDNAKTSDSHLLEIAHSKTLKTPVILGSNEKIEADKILIPDYTLYVDSKAHCILDAKAPKENITSGKHPQQAFYYAIHPDIKAPYYALCNGYTFTLFSVNGQELLLEVDLVHLDSSAFASLRRYLTIPIESLKQSPITNAKEPKTDDSWYLSRELPTIIKSPKKRAKARYFGCTAYFTRQSWDIVAHNIKTFTQQGDVVLDPFGGSGVTAIESCIDGRYGIHTDLNPLSIFMTKALCAKVNLSELQNLSEEIIAEFESTKPKNKREALVLLKHAKYYPNAIDKEFGEVASSKTQEEVLWIPKDMLLPKGSDVDSVLGLFSPMQLSELALLRRIIFQKTLPSGTNERRIYKRNMRYSLMLAFYNTITRCNLTFHYATSVPSSGDSGIYKYYRYRIAPKPGFLDIGEHFRGKIERVLKGKKELELSPHFYNVYFHPLPNVIKDFSGSMLAKRGDVEKVDSKDSINGDRFFQADATNLKEIESKSIDYIYTDPPYGDKIPYLDLSTMWNAWLDFEVDDDLKQKECIEKGSLEKTRDEYQDLMKQSLKEMYRVLKPNRWLSFVFQHQDPQLWQVLVEGAEAIGFEYVGSVKQKNGIESFKKIQNPFRVLSGQLIMHFKKVDNPKARVKEELGDTLSLVMNNAEALIARDDGATLEEIYAELQTRGLELGFLHELGKMYETLIPLINQNFDYDEKSKKFHIKKGEKFKSHNIPLENRTKYFIISYLRGCQRQGKKALFDDICLEIIPLLKNGVTPDTATIHDILQQVAFVDNKTGEWRLKTQERSLFDSL